MSRIARFASGRRAKFACPRCGEVIQYRNARYEPDTQTWVCGDCVDEVEVARKPIKTVLDAEALHHPRPPSETPIVSPQFSRLAWPVYLWAGTMGFHATSYADADAGDAEATLECGVFEIVTAVIADIPGAEMTLTGGDPVSGVAPRIEGAEVALAGDAPGVALAMTPTGVEADLSGTAPIHGVALTPGGVETGTETGTMDAYTDENGWGLEGWGNYGWGQ